MAYEHYMVKEQKYDNMYFSEDFSVDVFDKIRAGYDMDGDILLASYPKAGSTWMQELVWLLVNNIDIRAAKQTPVFSRVSLLELNMGGVVTLDTLANKPRPRLVKTHLPGRNYRLQLETNLKVILIVRNPKDVLVSLFHFYRMAPSLGLFPGSWDDFFELYKKKHLFHGDYIDFYRDWLPCLEKPNVKLVMYEDMVKNLRGVVEDLAEFLDKSLTGKDVAIMVEHLSFKSMSDNTMTNHSLLPFKQDISPFMRKGVIGDWKGYFSREQSEVVDVACRETFFGSDLVLQFE